MSFISLKAVLPAALGVLAEDNLGFVALVKPQFEADKDEVGEKGVVRDTEKEALEPERTAHSDNYLRLMLKAQVARDLFGIDYYYMVMKDFDDGYNAALLQLRR